MSKIDEILISHANAEIDVDECKREICGSLLEYIDDTSRPLNLPNPEYKWEQTAPDHYQEKVTLFTGYVANTDKIPHRSGRYLFDAEKIKDFFGQEVEDE
jgi:hypothetical protein